MCTSWSEGVVTVGREYWFHSTVETSVWHDISMRGL